MVSQTTIALDVMGGDFGPPVVIPAAARILEDIPDLRFILCGDQTHILPLLAKYTKLRDASDVIHTVKAISNDDKPATALRNSKNTSMRLAIEAVRDGKAHSVVSGGNTGALMAVAKIVLKPLPGINRPAICSILPSIKGEVAMLDLGANLECDAETLVQFAILGSLYAKIRKKVAQPTVGLLNVGSEEMKGPEAIRRASAILKQVEFPGQYVGYVEGDDIALGTTDVVVTDGFTGNVALKVAEGVGKLTGAFLKDAFKSSIFASIGGLFAYRALNRLKNRVDPRVYNGGLFLGLNGICVKSHGGSDEIGFASAIRVATQMARDDYLGQVRAEIQHLGEQESFVSEDYEESELT